MAFGWFIANYKRRANRIDGDGSVHAVRYCAMDDYSSAIFADGGDWSETEVLGNVAVVKVRALAATLSTIAADANMTRLPKDALATPLSDLTTNQKNAIVNKLQNMGYSVQELQNRFGGNIGNFTLGDVLRFAATRRLKPRYDQSTDTVILDGVVVTPRSVDDVDSTVL